MGAGASATVSTVWPLLLRAVEGMHACRKAQAALSGDLLTAYSIDELSRHLFVLVDPQIDGICSSEDLKVSSTAVHRHSPQSVETNCVPSSYRAPVHLVRPCVRLCTDGARGSRS